MSKILTGIDKSGSFRFYLGVTTDMVEIAREIHQTTPLATAGLGRALTATAMMSVMMKNDGDALTVSFKGDGPAQQIVACGYGNGDVRGYIANPDVDLPLKENGKLDVGASLGVGELTVIRDIGLKEPYVGTIALVDGEIANDLTAYYYISEQQNTSIALGVKVATDLSVAAAGGMFIQMLPGFEDAAVDALEDLLNALPPITTIVEEAHAEGNDEKEILLNMKEKIFGALPEEFATEVLDYMDTRWQCNCSREKMARALMTIGESELRQIIEEEGCAELKCHFCESTYQFSREELEVLADTARKRS